MGIHPLLKWGKSLAKLVLKPWFMNWELEAKDTELSQV